MAGRLDNETNLRTTSSSKPVCPKLILTQETHARRINPAQGFQVSLFCEDFILSALTLAELWQQGFNRRRMFTVRVRRDRRACNGQDQCTRDQ